MAGDNAYRSLNKLRDRARLSADSSELKANSHSRHDEANAIKNKCIYSLYATSLRYDKY